MKPPQMIETTRLLLRLPVLEDATAIFQSYAQDPAVTRYLTWLPHRSLDDTSSFLHRCISAWTTGSAYPWVVIQKQEDRLIGMAEVRIENFKLDLGYVLAQS